jgi:hypothetical protein
VEIGSEEFSRFFEVVLPHLDERQRRVVVEAAAVMVDNKTVVAEASGMSRNTVIKAAGEVTDGIERNQSAFVDPCVFLGWFARVVGLVSLVWVVGELADVPPLRRPGVSACRSRLLSVE